MERVINCSILTPEKLIYEGDVSFAVVSAHDGEMGFLHGHSPLISKLGIGEIRLNHTKKGDYLVVEGGVVEIKNNKLIILAEKAFKKEDLSVEDLDSKMKELDSQMTEMAPFSEEKFILKIEKDKLKVKLKIARR
jgi:F-type H+-transporting ATPase subunit epsilon